MTERLSSEITIFRLSSGSVQPVLAVPITRECKRRFYLMSEDNVTLKFNLIEPVEFKIGDYIDDELFGKFYLTEKQFPTFNETSGCYVYSLRFDAYYLVWANRVFMLTATASGTRIRKETSWILTEPLATHAQEVINNLSVLGYTYNGTAYTYTIHESATHAGEARCVSYDGANIIESLNTMANAFGCEWWVEGNTIHFGKCEWVENNGTKTYDLPADAPGYTFSLVGSGEDMLLNSTDADLYEANELRLGAESNGKANMVAITPQRNKDTYANRIYFFGSTENIPETYGKHLIFTVDSASNNRYRDSVRPVTPDMIVKSDFQRHFSVDQPVVLTTDSGEGEANPMFDGVAAVFRIGRYGKYSVTVDQFNIRTSIGWTVPSTAGVRAPSRTTIDVETSICAVYYQEGKAYVDPTFEPIPIQNHSRTVLGTNYDPEGTGHATIEFESPAFTQIATLSEGYFGIYVKALIDEGVYMLNPYCQLEGAQIPDKFSGSALPYSIHAYCPLVYNGTEYLIKINPDYADPDHIDYSKFVFDTTTPSGFGYGSNYTLVFSNGETEALEIPKVPDSYWESDYDTPAVLMKIGENRLRLPQSVAPGGYLESASAQDNDDTVEKVVFFDTIYPQCILRVTNITETKRKDTSDESEDTSWNWIQYSLSANQINGNRFYFRSSCVKAGVTLKARFLTPTEAGLSQSGATGYNLAGMTFEVLYDDETDTYTLKRNENYGFKLPNTELKPSVGDPFVLLGWDVRAMSSLGLIESAEEKLYDVAQDYMEALEEDMFIFRCRMFSDSMYALPKMPDFGQRVHVVYGGTGTKTSRILGYTFNLDMPWDTPEYEVGETDAYSRLKQLEDMMNEGNASISSISEYGDTKNELEDYITFKEAKALFVSKDKAGVAEWGDEGDDYVDLKVGEITKSLVTKSGNFFEVVTYYRDQETVDEETGEVITVQVPYFLVKLKDKYDGLFANGFISAGGISATGGGSGGGGGGGGSWSGVVLHNWAAWQNLTDDEKASAVLGADLGVALYNGLSSANNAIQAIQSAGYVTSSEVNTIVTQAMDSYSFFEVVQVNNQNLVKLKDTYAGLFANGFISAGGVSTTGGGGGASSLEGLTDVLISAKTSGDVLSYNGSRWVNIPQSSIVPDLSAYVTNSSLTTRLANYVTTTALEASYLTSTQIGDLYYNKTYIDSITFFEEVTSGAKTLLKLKDKYAGLFATGFISAGGISDTPSGGSSVNAIRSWDEYVATDTTQVLGANLGVSLNTRLQAVENAGYITSSALNGYALQSWVTTQISNSVPSATTALGDGKYIPNGTSVSSAICGFAIANGTNLSSSYSIGVNSDSSNPYIFLKQGGNVWYCQAYSNNFYFGPTYSSALCITTSGNGSLPGAFSADEFVKYGGTSSQFLKADGSVDSTSYATASALSTVSGNVSTLQGYFTNGSAKTALKLASPVTLWGQSFDASSNVSGALSSVTNLNSLVYLGSNAVGIGVSNPAYSLDVSGSARYTGNLYVAQKIYLDTSGNYYIELRNVGTTSSPVWALYTNAPIVSTSFISAGGVSTT